MQTVHINAGQPYDVLIGSGIIASLGEKLHSLTNAKKITVVSDDRVWSLYGEKVQKLLNEAGFLTECCLFAHGEESKNLTTYGNILEKMSLFGMTREDAVVALGGGVVGDVAGFAAATYQRGIPFVQVPTTLLAAVDSSVGGKTAVDLPSGKNQVGCFYQPEIVICDTDMLATLPIEEYRNGCAEIIKYAMLDGEELFEMISKTAVCSRYEDIIARCVAIKSRYVEADEFDKGQRMLLNFGHTIGHAIEACSNFSIPHGTGVAIGMAAITRAAVKKGYCDEEVSDRLQALIKTYGLPVEAPFDAENLFAAAAKDKKNTAATMRFIVPKRIGRCEILEASQKEAATWFFVS